MNVTYTDKQEEDVPMSTVLEKLISEFNYEYERLCEVKNQLNRKTDRLIGSAPIPVEKENNPEQPYEQKTLIEKLFTTKEWISRQINELKQMDNRLSEVI